MRDMLGRMVVEKTLDVGSGKQSFNISLADISSGVYSVTLSTSDQKAGTYKFIKQ
jgi:hypothetical protein